MLWPNGPLVGGRPFIRYKAKIKANMMPEEQKKTVESVNDAGAEARANDIIDALIEVKAWQDGERKAAAEAEELHNELN